jgi:hypothetical protein
MNSERVQPVNSSVTGSRNGQCGPNFDCRLQQCWAAHQNVGREQYSLCYLHNRDVRRNRSAVGDKLDIGGSQVIIHKALHCQQLGHCYAG